MKKLTLLLLFCLVSTLTYAENSKYNTVTLRTLPSMFSAGEQGLAGAYICITPQKVGIFGGCNFPDVSAAEGGQKMFYDQTYQYENGAWSLLKTDGSITAMAYGASVQVPDGTVWLGGFDGSQSYDAVSVKGETEVTLPALPHPLQNFAAAYDATTGYIYVAGGESNGSTSNKAWRLHYPDGKTWEILPDMPGEPRVQPCGVVQNNNQTSCFYVFGGYHANDTDAASSDEGLMYNPVKKEWSKTSAILNGKACLVGASAMASGSQHILFFGGVNKEIFNNAIQKKYGNDYLRHEVEWYKFRKEIMVYNTITGAWSTIANDSRLARAGAAVAKVHDDKYGDEIWMVNGESMPGIRSTDVTAVKIGSKADFGWLNWSVLVLYLLGMIALGYYFMRRESGAEDFFKGGGRIPWWAAGISIYATMLSAITYMAYPAKAFATDWTYYPMLITILIVSFPVCHYYLPFFRRLNVTTAYEYLERRFNAVTRLMASALFIIFMVARMALVLYLPSLALTAVTGIDIYICIVLMAAITIVYCTMGGVEAVVWGDVVQGFILVGGAIFAVIYLIVNTEGGFSGFWDIAIADDKLRLFDWSLSYKSATFWVIIIGGMANNLISYTSDQTVIQRYLTTKDEGEARRSIMLNGVMSVFVSVAFFAIGAGLYTFFKTHPAEMDITMAKNDIIFPFFMMSQLPAGLAGLLIAAIFAATMSTISSNINSVATAFSVDFYKRFRPQSSEKSVLSCARYTCIISGVIGMLIALLMATWNILSLLDFFQEILGLLSSGLGGLFLMGIFFPRIGGKAALIGFISGVAAVFATKNLTDASFLLYGAIGMVVCVLTGYLFSFILHEKEAGEGLTWKTLPKE